MSRIQNGLMAAFIGVVVIAGVLYWNSQKKTPLPTTTETADPPPRQMMWSGHWEDFEKPDEAVLREKLTPLQYKVTQESGTERAFQNEYYYNDKPGIYVDIVSGEPLFSSTDKFASGSGWPSFTSPLMPELIVQRVDRSHGMVRTEVRSFYGDSHLGHLFDDGPEPTGLRYCINSASLRFIPLDRLAEEGYEAFQSLFEN